MAKIYEFPQGAERSKLKKKSSGNVKNDCEKRTVTRLSGTLNGSGFIYVLLRLAHCI